MNSKVERADGLSGSDIVKLLLAAALALGGVYAYYHFSGWGSLERAAILIVPLLAALGVAAYTAPGETLREYISESRFELRKVVWPTRDETIRTTGIILVVVFILSLLLGFIDLILKWLVMDTLLQLGS